MSLTDVELAYLREQFVKKVNKDTKIRPTGEHYNFTEDCWDWTGTISSGGYGEWKTNLCRTLKIDRTHRLSVFLFNNSIWNAGKVVRHKCDRPSCVNPAHLEIGTKGDNNRDTVSRGRKVCNPPTGVNHGNSIFTAEQVEEIKALRLAGHTCKSIADKFNAYHLTIENLLNGKTKYLSTPVVIPSRIDTLRPEILRMSNEGKSIASICKELKTHFSTVKKILDNI